MHAMEFMSGIADKNDDGSAIRSVGGLRCCSGYDGSCEPSKRQDHELWDPPVCCECRWRFVVFLGTVLGAQNTEQGGPKCPGAQAAEQPWRLGNAGLSSGSSP